MIRLLRQIANFIIGIIEFALMIISGMLTLISMIPSALIALQQGVMYLPPMLISFALATITISVIMLIIGRMAGNE